MISRRHETEEPEHPCHRQPSTVWRLDQDHPSEDRPSQNHAPAKLARGVGDVRRVQGQEKPRETSTPGRQAVHLEYPVDRQHQGDARE